MTEEQNKEVMRLADEIADYAWKEGLSDGAYTNAKQDRECRAESRAELEAYLRTIWIASQASNTFPINPNGASKWAHLQKHDGAEAIGVVFRTGSGSVGSLVDGRVVWADWLAHPNGSKPESVNAELLEALRTFESSPKPGAFRLGDRDIWAAEHERQIEEKRAMATELKALREQMPVGIVDEGDDGVFADLETTSGVIVKLGDKLYARPVPAHRLTDEEINDLGFQCGLQPEDAVNPSVEEFARAIEATLFGDKSQSSEAGG